MPKRSAGILMYRRAGPEILVLLVHPGGPYWAKKDIGAWSIPKGEYEPPEEPLAAAKREFAEELGSEPQADGFPLGEVRQTGGKIVTCFALEGDFDTTAFKSNTFACEWPPRSGRLQSFPEVDKAEWFAPGAAAEKIVPAQRAFIERLQIALR
jgi:predicted NUDIX family NTP pyrophosphohydrolase